MCDNGIVIMFKRMLSALKELYITRNEKKVRKNEATVYSQNSDDIIYKYLKKSLL